MSDDIQNLKKHIKQAFANVESAEFLKKKTEECRIRFTEDFVSYILNNPFSNFREWSSKLIAEFNVNTTVSEEKMKIGIAVLALDELEQEITDLFVKTNI